MQRGMALLHTSMPRQSCEVALSAHIRHKGLSMDGTYLPYGLFHRLWKTSVLQDGTLTSACCPVSSYWHSMDFCRYCLKQAVGGAITRQGARPQSGDDITESTGA